MTTLPEWANWLARDEDGELYAYSVKPLKEDGYWNLKNLGDIWIGVEETDDSFSHVKWTDEEPIEIKRGLEAGGISVEEMTQTAEKVDIINEPNHYKGKHGIETIDVIRNFGNDDMVAGFYWGNAIKYMTRYRNKNGLEDLKKARRNLDWLIEHTEKVE